MPESAAFDPVRIIEVLDRHSVRFVVIGGFAAWTQGVPAVTTDLDIVFERSDANIDGLVHALHELSAVYRDPAGRHLRPEAARLASSHGSGHHLFRTDSGDLDVLRSSSEFDYERLHPQAIEVEVEGIRLQLAPLRLIIAMKEAANRPKDRAALPLLRAALDDET